MALESSLFIANSGFISHSLVAPRTRRVLADQHNAPETSVKIYGDVSIIQQYQLIVCITINWGHGWHLVLGSM